MKSTSTFIEGHKSTVDNSRGHEVVMDLPPAKGGTDEGATALEIAVRALSGCITTIFSVVAKNSNCPFSGMTVVIEADKGDEDKTITAVRADVTINSSESEKKVLRIFEKTMATCPVGILYEQAGIEIKTDVKVIAE